MRAIPMAILLILLPAAAFANIPDVGHSTFEWAYSGEQPLSLFILPGGAGQALTEAYLPGGQTTDATITITVIDDFLNPVPLFPREDMWLESDDGAMISCSGGAIADTDTDANGQAMWSNPICAGSWSVAPMYVMISGIRVPGDGLPLSVNSADLDGNLLINLADVGIFAADLAAGYHYRSDFNFDGVINLIDVARMAGGVATTGP